MREGSIVVLAIIMGLMLAFDMGGPVNKVAYAFMLICVSRGLQRGGYRRRRHRRAAAGHGAGDADRP
jgi:fructose-specific phosphotransferase system IIC component